MIQVNAMGKACPLPVIEAKQAVEALTGPDTVEVLVDNEIAVQNLQKLAAQKGLEAAVETRPGGFAVLLTVTGAPSPAPAEQPAAPCPSCGSIVVAVGSDCMGCGDDTLGSLLMRSFLFALTKQDVLPGTVLFYNGGARLTCQGSPCLEDLQTLADAGVEILTCGTCLNHYGLTEQLAIGAVTNMYEIVARQMAAAKVIRP